MIDTPIVVIDELLQKTQQEVLSNPNFQPKRRPLVKRVIKYFDSADHSMELENKNKKWGHSDTFYVSNLIFCFNLFSFFFGLWIVNGK